MTKKLYALIQGIAATAINEICGLYVRNDLDKISV